MKKVPAMWVGLGVAGFTAGALVMGFGECTGDSLPGTSSLLLS
jgi:hypothetical protein